MATYSFTHLRSSFLPSAPQAKCKTGFDFLTHMTARVAAQRNKGWATLFQAGEMRANGLPEACHFPPCVRACALA